VYELSLIENVPNVVQEIKKDFNIDVRFERAKELLEENDGCGKYLQSHCKTVLIGTAVVGATTMIFSIIMALTHGLTQDVGKLSLAACTLCPRTDHGRRHDLLVHRCIYAGCNIPVPIAPWNSSRPTSSSKVWRKLRSPTARK